MMFQQLLSRITKKQEEANKQFEQKLSPNNNRIKNQIGTSNQIYKTNKQLSISVSPINIDIQSSHRKSTKDSRATPINNFKHLDDHGIEEYQEEENLPTPNLRKKRDPENVTNCWSNQVNYQKNNEELQNPQDFKVVGKLNHVCDACSEHHPTACDTKKNFKLPRLEIKNKKNETRKQQKKLIPLRRGSHTVKTQIGQIKKLQARYVEQNSDLEKQFSTKKDKDALKSSNIKIQSNVISYCQSLKSSNAIDNSYIQSCKNQRKSKHRKSKLKEVGKIRYRTQEQKFDQQVEQFMRKQKIAKLHLKVIYQKKKSLQQRLKKLNYQISQISSIKLNPILNNIDYSQNSLVANEGSIVNSPKVGSIYYTHKNYSHQQNAYQYDQKYLKHKEQMQKNKRAIQFVKKVSKQSLKRRIQHQKKINKEIYQRIKEHACGVDCSRIRCQKEIIEGYTKKQPIIKSQSLYK